MGKTLVLTGTLPTLTRDAAKEKIEAAGGGLLNMLSFSWNEARPVIPAPHQIAAELWKSIFTVKPWMPKSLVYHGWVTLSSTLLGFVLGALLGIVLAIGIVHVRFLAKSLMPWIIASQTIPILAIAPMVIVVLGSLGFTGLLPKSLISMYLCFFPVTIGMVKGLTSPEVMQLDLMRTYNAGTMQVLGKLRFPASVPFLFTSLKVAVAIALTGAAWIDPLVSLAVAAMIVAGTWGLFRESLDLALDAVPRGVEPEAIEAALAGLPGVAEVHDLHVWGASTSEISLTAHLVVSDGVDRDAVLAEAETLLRDRFRVAHSTIQIESVAVGPSCAQRPAEAL